MKRTKQATNVDCFSACLASLLEVPLQSVPCFYKEGKQLEPFYSQAQRWLRKHHAMTLVTIIRPEGMAVGDLFFPWSVPSRFLASVTTPAGFHAVVVALYKNGPRVVWDPSGNKPGSLKDAVDFSFLLPLFKKGAPCRLLPLKSIA